MNSIVKTLMRRDNIAEDEAVELIADVKSEMMCAIEEGNYMEAEEIFMSDLGLELDYIFDIL